MAPSELSKIGRLELPDLPQAEALVAEAGWNQVAADWRMFLDFGTVYAVQGRIADAIREYETVLEMGDGDINTRTFLCHQYWVTNRYREAESCLKYVLRHDPHNKSAIQLYPYVTAGLEHSKHEP